MSKILPALIVTILLGAPTLAQVEEAPVVTAITVTGNETTDTTLIERIMGVKIGDRLDMDGMDAAWDALEDCGHFRFVE